MPTVVKEKNLDLKIKKEIQDKLAVPKGKTKKNLLSLLISEFQPITIDTNTEYKNSLKLHSTLLKYCMNKSRSVPKDKINEIREFLKLLRFFIKGYEEKKYAHLGSEVTGVEILVHLIDDHKLNQSDLKNEIGSQSIVSQILSGKRKLNTKQISALSKRFSVSPAVFID